MSAMGGFNMAAAGLFVMPRTVTVKGGNYFINDSEEIYSIDASGIYWKYEKYDLMGKVKVGGGNYMISSKGVLHTVNHQGTISFFEKDSKKLDLSEIKLAGGIFFYTKDKTIVVNHKGSYNDVTKFAPKAEDIVMVGNNYALTKDGTLHTFGEFINDKKLVEVYVYSYKAELPVLNAGTIKARGGNFILTNTDELVTISFAGNATNKGKMKFKNYTTGEELDFTNLKVKSTGGNYLVYENKKIWTVDYMGEKYMMGDKIDDAAVTNFPITGIVK
jgi:hypothetical protein